MWAAALGSFSAMAHDVGLPADLVSTRQRGVRSRRGGEAQGGSTGEMRVRGGASHRSPRSRLYRGPLGRLSRRNRSI